MRNPIGSGSVHRRRWRADLGWSRRWHPTGRVENRLPGATVARGELEACIGIAEACIGIAEACIGIARERPPSAARGRDGAAIFTTQVNLSDTPPGGSSFQSPTPSMYTYLHRPSERPLRCARSRQRRHSQDPESISGTLRYMAQDPESISATLRYMAQCQRFVRVILHSTQPSPPGVTTIAPGDSHPSLANTCASPKRMLGLA
jgi:hypothetical protein